MGRNFNIQGYNRSEYVCRGLEKLSISQELVTVTHQQSHTNTAIANIGRNSKPGTDIVKPTAGVAASSADIAVLNADVTASSADIIALNDEFSSVS